jgi:hypothetical protein
MMTDAASPMPVRPGAFTRRAEIAAPQGLSADVCDEALDPGIRTALGR